MVYINDIQNQALKYIASDGRGVAARLADKFRISRQAANKHLQALSAAGLVDAEGNTRGRIYRLRALQQAERSFNCAGLMEDVFWREVCVSVITGLPENVRDIWRYGMTEMVNNAIEHSGSAEVHAGIRRNAVYTDGWVADDGVGIFFKIQQAFNLYDPREAILELAKGKLTTDPDHHTGEGIFFTSRVFDAFDIQSGRLYFMHDHESLDVLVERPVDAPGSLVLMRLGNDSKRTLQSVFDEFAAPEAYTFDKTVVPVRLAQYEGEKLVSRSQAKRLTMRFERFHHVVLDFEGVAEIGQAFADELFRVFASAHPGIWLEPVNMTKAVSRMVTRARAHQ